MLVPGRFSSAAIGIGEGEVELRLTDGGNWRVQVRSTDREDWRMLCRGHIDGTIFETASAKDQEPVTVGPLRVDPAARCVEVHGAPVPLTAREFELVALLATEPARVFTKDELLREVWKDRGGGSSRTLDSHASRARNKLRNAGAEGFIVNCWRVGYMLWAGGDELSEKTA
jgi:DNA-binding response OmpR family regulator